MGEYFIIVNPAKRQYIDSHNFNENCKASGFLFGSHAEAVAILVCRPIARRTDMAGIGGLWLGDPIYGVGDYGPPNEFGIETTTDDDPHRNLYQMASAEFEDLSFKLVGLFCDTRTYYCNRLAQEAASGGYALQFAGDVYFTAGSEALELALQRYVGADWMKKYKALQRI